ncbi:MAG: hypothetical protein Q7T53_03540 [Deltaproteobacteria bacterium]|nr:hypothetical protein [Deltaproteobacteria bacterium]
MKHFLTAISLLVFFVSNSLAQSQTVFSGMPTVKINEGGIERFPEQLSQKTATGIRCVISKIGDKYYWATRENKEMFRRVSGAFIVYFAADGAGYVKIISPERKQLFLEELKKNPKLKEIPGLVLTETEEKFDYVEHLSFGLKSISYYGTMVDFDDN